MILSRAIKQNDTVCIIKHFTSQMETAMFLDKCLPRSVSTHSEQKFASTTFYFFGVISGRPRTDVGNWLMCCWAVRELPWPFCLRIEDKGSAKFISSWEGCQRDAAVGKEGQEGTDGPLLNICHFPLKKEHLLILWVEGLWVTSKLTEPNFWLWSSHGHSPVLREKKKKTF